MTERVAVLLDFQNVHLTGYGLFGRGREPYRCVPHPVRVADLLASRRARPSVAATIHVYRGQPHPVHQPTARSRERGAGRVLDPRPARPGDPPPAQLPQLADAATNGERHRCRDRRRPDAAGVRPPVRRPDPLLGRHRPLTALETIARLKLGHVEVACWSGAKPLRFRGTNLPYCHFLSMADWDAVTEDWHGRI